VIFSPLGVKIYVYSLPKQLIDSILPADARRILINSIQDAGEARDTLRLFQNVEAQMLQYASDVRHSLNPLYFESRCLEFESFLRKVLSDLGNRVDLSSFTPVPLEDPTVHENLSKASKAAGFYPEHGYCDAVYMDSLGRASAHRAHIVRLSHSDIFADFQESEGSFHVIRFIALCPQMPSIQKMRVFVRMVRLLLRTATRVSGKPATSNDGCIRMDSSGDWRFLKESSPHGDITRLERFWLRSGGISERLVIPNSPYVLFFRDTDALEVAREWRIQKPNDPSPYALASRFSHFAPATLEKLRF
jgi:hypothetical protein